VILRFILLLTDASAQLEQGGCWFRLKYILLLKYAVFIESNKNTHIFTINYHENA